MPDSETADTPADGEFHIVVQKTARYYVVGAPTELVRDVWIVCHGFSQLARAFVAPFRVFWDDSRYILAPEALSRFYLDTSPSHSKSTDVGATWMTREDRDAEITDTVTYLDALYERVLEELAAHGASRDMVRVHALGFSQGGAAVCRWAARGSAVLDNLVVWAHRIPEDVNLRALSERRPKLTLDVVYGVRDQYVNDEVLAAQKAVLDGSGMPFTIHEFEGGHTLNTAMLRKLMGV